MAHCHCTICRKHRGAPFATYVAAPLDAFRYTAGEDQLQRYPPVINFSEPGYATQQRTLAAATRSE